MLVEFSKWLVAQAHSAGDIDLSKTVYTLPDGVSNTLRTERFKQVRDRRRNRFTTQSLPSFVEYVSNEHSARTGLCTIAGLTATHRFNMMSRDGEPGHCDDIAYLELQPGPAFQAVCELCEEAISPEMFREFIFDFHLHIQDSDKLLAAVNNISVMQNKKLIVTNKSDTQGNESVGNESVDYGEMPLTFTIELHPYEGFVKRALTVVIGLECDLSKSKDVKVLLRIRAARLLQDVLNTEFTELINSKAPEGTLVVQGDFKVLE